MLVRNLVPNPHPRDPSTTSASVVALVMRLNLIPRGKPLALPYQESIPAIQATQAMPKSSVALLNYKSDAILPNPWQHSALSCVYEMQIPWVARPLINYVMSQDDNCNRSCSHRVCSCFYVSYDLRSFLFTHSHGKENTGNFPVCPHPAGW